MTDFITALTGTNGISSSTLWGEVTAAAPFVILIFVFSFGYRVLRRSLKSGVKAKPNI